MVAAIVKITSPVKAIARLCMLLKPRRRRNTASQRPQVAVLPLGSAGST